MKGQSKRFVDHKGEAYDVEIVKKKEKERGLGFLDLWRYATSTERAMTVLGCMVAWISSAGLIGAVIIYGELTSLFVQRHKAEGSVRVVVLTVFGGGRIVTGTNRDEYMDALVEDSIAFALASVAMIAVQMCSAAAAVTMANWSASRLVKRIRWRLLRAALRQEMAYFDTNKTLNLATNITEDMDKIRLGVGEHVVMCSYLVGSVVVGICMALGYGWQLALVGLAVVPLSIIVAATVAKYQTRCSNQEVSAYSIAGRVVEEALSALRTVRAYGGEKVEVDRYGSSLLGAGTAARRRGVWSGAGAGLGWLLTFTLNAVVFAHGASLCVRDMHLPPEQMEYHPGVMLTILFCTFMAAQNIAMCHPHLELFSIARGAAVSIYQILERESEIDALSEEGERPVEFRGDVVFEDIYFNYPARPDVKVLRGLNLKIKAGETVALVGSSGCGKSTVLQLLQRMYIPHGGKITVDGVDLSQLNLHHFRSSIGVVGQEPVLFSGTIRENILMGLTNVSEQDLIAAAKTANAHQFIAKLSSGYDTSLGERGAQLSGGQKQRIAIARAIIRNPKILLLDEATSALDPVSERQVQAALDAASVGRTTLVVSHRLSTIVNATRIVYMEQGAVLEQGTYKELVEQQGLFWSLVQADMTSRSTTEPSSQTEPEDAEHVLENEDQTEPFTREFSRSTIHRESLTPERCIRGSHRIGSVSAAHVPNAASSNLMTHDLLADYPEEDEDSSVPPVSSWQILKLNAPEWPLLLIGGVASLCVGATMPIFALLFSKIYGMFASSDAEEILAQSRLYAGLFFVVAAVCGAVTFLQTWLFSLAGARLTDRLRVQTFETYMKQEQGWFDLASNSVGALSARLATDCAAVQGATGSRLGTLLQGISTMFLGVSLAMAYSWKMTLVSLLSVPCVMGGIYLEGFVMKRSEAKERKAVEQAARIATEAVLNVRTVQSLSVEKSILDRYRVELDNSRASTAGYIRGPVYGLCLCAPTLGYAVSLSYGGWLIARDDLPYEYAILVSEALIYGAWMLAEALSFAPNFAAAKRAASRIIHTLARQPAIVDMPTAIDNDQWTATGKIRYSSISFHYPTRASVTVLKNLSLDIAAGSSVALVGPSGCGKSTLVALLMRLYEPSQGTVELDGLDIKTSLTLAALRRQFGLVQQEPVVFGRSVRDNIAYGDNTRAIPMEEVVEAAKKANVHAFIASLPLGYETNLGVGGAQLSGGQKQRIAIARALVRNPKILLLDEATSALDASSEKTVQEALEKASEGRTTILIAHRLATIRNVDTICVIDKGVVAEMGTHEQLIKKKGLYFDLWQQQGPPAATTPS